MVESLSKLQPGEVVAYSVFAGYFLLILISFGFVLRSILSGQKAVRLLEGRPFLFIRIAVGALISTWYFMIEYMKWSYNNYSYTHPSATYGQWLQNTALFDEAWSIVSTGPSSWWWSSWICTWTVVFTAVVWIESGRRGIKHPWAYMLLGQLVAISVSTSLFLTATSLRPRKYSLRNRSILILLLPLTAAMVTIYRNPLVVGTTQFMPNLLAMHALLLVPLVFPPKASADVGQASPYTPSAVYAVLLPIAGWVHRQNTKDLLNAIPGKPVFTHLYRHIFSHSAQASISLDVLWVGVALTCWFLVTGSFKAIAGKTVVAAVLIGAGVASLTGVNWALIGSVIPILVLATVGGIIFRLNRLRSQNEVKRKAILDSLGVVEETVIAGTTEEPPKMAGRRTVVGFWHPYCNAGGGGERVLWTAIAHLQRAHPEVVSLVYSGDYPAASKEEILGKIKDRFSIELAPSTLHFIPLLSRHLVDDTYWKRFTLLGQSVGSIYLAWEGLAGKDGLWGDIFLDSMGYAFTYPVARFLAGPELTIGAYVHYPTVSADMVKRVRARSYGVENAGASSSFFRTQVKLLYYRIFTSLYSTALLFSEFSMTNSSWTQAHITSLLIKGRSSFLASVFLLDEKSYEVKGLVKPQCEVIYPPCDTAGLVGLGKLEKRERSIVSLAQFRPEKEHVKQVLALAELVKQHPQYRSGPEKITLTMMGGARHPADEARVESLRTTAKELDLEDNIEFLVNAPYPEIVRRLGKASIGLNTMQDEHFGINVVEFMAAGLIPIVHASAGPLLDIVVPYKGQQTGFHAITPDEFAEAIHRTLSMSLGQQTKMRKAARELAVSKFSEERFDEGWERGWGVLVGKVEERRKVGRG